MRRKLVLGLLVIFVLAGVVGILVCRGGACRKNPSLFSSSTRETGAIPNRNLQLPGARQLATNPALSPSAAVSAQLLGDAVDRRARSRHSSKILYRRRGTPLSQIAATATDRLTVGTVNYHFLPSVRALPASAFPDDDRYAVVDARAGYVFFQPAPGDEVPEGTRPVVYNDVSKSLGVVTGALSIKWENPAAKDSLALDYQLQPVQSFDDLQVTYFQSTKGDVAGFSLLLNQLRADKRVVQADPQILERTYKAQ